MNLIISEFKDDHAFLSNFYLSPIVLPGGHVAPSLEHAFQAYKCRRDEDFELILSAATPGAAKRLGRQVSLRMDWEAAKIKVMRWLLTLKFYLNGSELSARLLATDDALLIEGNSWGDRFWGVYEDVGDNWLGYLLMGRRAELRAVARDETGRTR
jgi:ribA/ribD-fused uncharacterized protein